MDSQQLVLNNRYYLLESLGKGGMGTVYRSIDRLSGQEVALKRVTLEATTLSTDSITAGLEGHFTLAREFQILASLRHPHIISVLDYGFDEVRQPYFTMSLLSEHQNIRHAAEKSDTQRKIKYLVQIVQALVYLHQRGVLHRDLKPGNVIIDDKDNVKLLDFGLAKFIGTSEYNQEDVSGTLLYMAPELFMGQSASIQSDLYAIGVIAFELFAENYPFAGKNVLDLIQNIQNTIPDFEVIPAIIRPVVQQLLAKEKVERFTTAAETLRALNQLLDTPQIEDQQIRESFLQAARFVGREAEMQRLETSLKNALDSRGSMILIGGESGVGKTRLLSELRGRALVRGAKVAQAAGLPGGGLPYQLWREILPRLILSTRIEDQTASILKEIVPNISDLVQRPIPNAPELTGRDGHRRLIQAIESVVKLQQEPIMLILEDLHWTSESLEPLHGLLNDIKTRALFIVGTYRSDEQVDLPQIFPAAETMHLARLSQDAIEQLSISMLGEAGRNSKLINFLKNETEGNTFFMVEVVRALAEEAGQLSRVGQHELPTSVLTQGIHEILQRRLNQIAPTDQPLLHLAAVSARQIDQTILQTLYPDTDIEAWLYRCNQAAVLDVQNEHWQFSHEKLREQILRDLTPAEQIELNRQVAQAIETCYPDSKAHTAVLAEHWHLANDNESSIKYLIQSSDSLRDLSQYKELKIACERGLERIKTVPLTKQNQIYRIQLLNNQGFCASEFGELDTAEDYHWLALAFAQKLGDKNSEIDAIIGLAHIAEDRANVELAQKYYERATREGDLARQLKGISGEGRVAILVGDFDIAYTLFKKAYEMAQQQSDQAHMGVNIHNMGLCLLEKGELDEAEKLFNESQAIYNQLGNKWAVESGYLNLANIQAAQGNLTLAIEFTRKCLVSAREGGNRLHASIALGNLGGYYSRQEDYATSLNYYQQYLKEATTIQDRWGIVEAHIGLALTYTYLTKIDMARERLREGFPLAREIDLPPLYLMFIFACAVIKHAEENYQCVAEWLGFIINHPALDFSLRDDVERFRPKLAAKLNASELTAAMGKGKTLTMANILTEIEQMLKSK